jgi:hypothetical protein
MIPCNSYYGEYRTRTFADIFGDVNKLVEAYNTFPPSSTYTGGLTQTEVETIYYLLYARYGNSHIAYTDENQFKYALYSVIWQYGPTWKKRLDVQEQLRQLEYSYEENGIFHGGKAIYNHSYNPSSAPTTSELLTINDQNTTNYKKSQMEGYSQLLSLLETDVTGEFIDKFKKLFIVVTAPDYPLYYTTEVE